MRLHSIVQVSLVPAHLFAKSAAAPDGQIHVAISRQFDDGPDTFTLDTADVMIDDKALCDRAKQLYADIAQHYADSRATAVRDRGDKTAPLVEPRSR